MQSVSLDAFSLLCSQVTLGFLHVNYKIVVSDSVYLFVVRQDFQRDD